jgi:hypothetical protein
MKAQFRHSRVVNQTQADVFRIYAQYHVLNHPSWDPDIELEQQTSDLTGVGIIINRRNRHNGVPIGGSMEVVEDEPNQSIAMRIHDGPVEMHGRTTFEVVSPDQTLIASFFEIPNTDENVDKNFETSA